MEKHYNIHLTFWIASIFMWILFIWVRFSDPGYIKPNRQAYEDAVKMVSEYLPLSVSLSLCCLSLSPLLSHSPPHSLSLLLASLFLRQQDTRTL